MEKQVTVQIEAGLEARPIAMLVQIASKFNSTVYLESDGRKVNAKSIMGMMSLALKTGDSINIIAEGDDEKEAVDGVEKYLANKTN